MLRRLAAMTVNPFALHKRSLVRFLVSGGINSALTYGIFLLLLMVSSYAASFTIAYVAGILLAYLLNRFFVFNQHRGLKSLIWLPCVYLLQYILNMMFLWCWVEKWGLAVRVAPLASIVATLPVTYFFSRRLFQPVGLSRERRPGMPVK